MIFAGRPDGERPRRAQGPGPRRSAGVLFCDRDAGPDNAQCCSPVLQSSAAAKRQSGAVVIGAARGKKEAKDNS